MIHDLRASVRSAKSPPAPGGCFLLSAAATEEPTSVAKSCVVVTLGEPSGDYGKPLPNTEMAQMIRRKGGNLQFLSAEQAVQTE